MGQYNKNRSFDKGRRGRNDRGFRGGNGKSQNMYSAVCSECGKTCEVPFKPTGDKPVFCSECFSNKKDGGSRNDRKDFSKRNFNNQKPKSFDSNFAQNSQKDFIDIKRSIDNLNVKIDKLFSIIETQKSVKTENKSTTPIVSSSIKKTISKKTITKKVTAKKTPKKVVKKVAKKK